MQCVFIGFSGLYKFVVSDWDNKIRDSHSVMDYFVLFDLDAISYEIVDVDLVDKGNVKYDSDVDYSEEWEIKIQIFAG